MGRLPTCRRRIASASFWALGACLFAGTCAAAELLPAPNADQPTVLQDDARLNDVQLLGARLGWAAGEQGVVWQTTDGGETWKFKRTPVSGSLRSICFLTDKVGWIVGGEAVPYSKVTTGIV